MILEKINFKINKKGSVLALPCFALGIFLFLLNSCTVKFKGEIGAKNDAKILKLNEIVKSKNSSEEKGAMLSGYQLQDNDRIYFNALSNYLLEKYDTAFAGFNLYKSLDSTNASTYYYLAQLKGRNNYLKETLKDAQKAVVLSPDNKWMQSYYAGVLAFSENYDSAAAIFMNIGKNNINDRNQAYLTASKLLQRAGKTEKAIAIIDTLLELTGKNNEEFLQEKQSIYVKSTQLEKAIEVTQQLITAYPLSPEYSVQLVELYEMYNEPLKAAETLKKIEQKFHNNGDVASYIFGYYLRKRDVDAIAIKLNDYVDVAEKNNDDELSILRKIGEYIAGNPKDTSVINYLSELAQKIVTEKPNNLIANRLNASLKLYGSNAKVGEKLYLNLIEKYPNNYNVWQPLSEYYVYSKPPDTSLAFLDKMEKVFPDSVDILMNKMFILESQKKYKNALVIATKGVDLSQKQKSKEKEMIFFNSIAHNNNELKNYAASDSTYEALLTKDPNNTMALNNYAYNLSERGEKLEYALNLSKKTLESDYYNSNNLDTYGWILYKLGRYEEARTYIEKAIAYSGDNVSVVVLEHFGDIEFRLGNVENALKIWKTIDKSGQGSSFLKKKIKDKKIYE